MRIEKLSEHHDLSDFACGEKDLDDWLRNHAVENQRRNLTRTFVLVNDLDEVIGYYATVTGEVAAEDLPTRYSRGLPLTLSPYGMILLARIAVRAESQARGLGRDLFASAVLNILKAVEHVAGRFIAVDPLNESARAFYTHFGFRDIPGDEHGRMYIRVDEAAAAFGH